MKRYQTANLLEQVFIPVIAYLLAGLVFMKFSHISVNSTYYVVWGIMAGIILGIKEYFANKTVTVAMGIYIAVVVVWFGLFMGAHNRIHAVLAALGIGAVIIIQKIFHFKIIKVLFGYGMLVLLICSEFADISFSKGIVALAIILFLNSVSETLSFFYHGNVNSLIIIYAVIAMITVIMPASEEPYDWGFVKRAVMAVNEMVEKIAAEIQYQWGFGGSDGIFHYGYTGYSDSPFSLSTSLGDRDIMQIMVQGKRTKRNFYLKGNVCDSYTGNSWETNIHEETIPYQTDTLMTLYAVFHYTQDKERLQKFMEVHKQEVTLLNIKTQSLFYPLKLLEITAANLESDGDNLRSEKINARGYSYSYEFVDFDYASPELIQIMKDSKDITYDEDTYNLIFDKMKEYYDVELEKIPFSVFLEQTAKGQESVEQQYTVLGDSVSENVRILADTVTEGCSNDYEKCKVLESYLYQYHYSKIIDVPENVNVLDWFLFDRKEGYCAHYATALAAMLRCEGIPSRIAEGFLVDYKEHTDFYEYSVSGNRAHVWVEAYLEGFGWIRLEPTVVNAAEANMVWYADMTAAEEEDPENDEPVEEIVAEEEPDSTENPRSIWFMMLSVLGGMAVIIIGILMVLVIHRRIYIRKSNDPDVILQHLLSVFGKKISPKEDGETLSEYFQRISADAQITEEMGENLIIIQKLMEGYWYGEGYMDADDVKAMKEKIDKFCKSY